MSGSLETRLAAAEEYISERRLQDKTDRNLIADLAICQDENSSCLKQLVNRAESLEKASRSHNVRFSNLPYSLTDRVLTPESREKQATDIRTFLLDVFIKGFGLAQAKAESVMEKVDNYHPVGRGVVIVAMNRMDRKLLLRSKFKLRDYKYCDRKIFLSDDLTKEQQRVEREVRMLISKAKETWPAIKCYSMREGNVRLGEEKMPMAELNRRLKEDSGSRLTSIRRRDDDRNIPVGPNPKVSKP